jgi:hypothetical protein
VPARVEDRQEVRRQRFPLHVRAAKQQPDDVAEGDEVLVRAVRSADRVEQLADRHTLEEAADVEVPDERAALDRPGGLSVRERARRRVRAVEVRRVGAVEEVVLDGARQRADEEPGDAGSGTEVGVAELHADDAGGGAGEVVERRLAELRLPELRVAELRLPQLRLPELRLAELETRDGRAGEAELQQREVADSRPAARRGPVAGRVAAAEVRRVAR